MEKKPSVISYVLRRLERTVETTRVRRDEVGGMQRLAVAIFAIEEYLDILEGCKLTMAEAREANNALIALIDQSMMIPEVKYQLEHCRRSIEVDYFHR